MSNVSDFRDPIAQNRDNMRKQNTVNTDNPIRNPAGSMTSLNARRNQEKNKSKILLVGAVLIIIIAIIGRYYFYPTMPTCNMNMAENRDFNRYYGLNGSEIHFTRHTADNCDSNVIFKPALPQAILKADNSASSFLTLAEYGTGKTSLRCEYYKSLKSHKYLKILILNNEISEYMERFVKKNFANEKECKITNCLQSWTDNEFAQIILSRLVTEFIKIMNDKQIQLKSTSIEEKMQLITIICYYYNGGASELESFINYFLGKSVEFYQASKAIVQIQERNIAQDKPLLIHFKKDLHKFSALQQDYEKLHLLLAVTEGEGFQYKAIEKDMFGNIFNDLTHFSLYIKNHLNKIPVFIIDGIDENRYFFNKDSVNKESMESFCHSSISQEILSKVMANNFYLSIFYPKIAGTTFERSINRVDKFPILSIDWTTDSLINYADYVLQEMNKIALPSRCKSFKDFKTLVNYYDPRCRDIINKIKTPRQLHHFMTELITQMNNDATKVYKPFKATLDNVDTAYKKSYENFRSANT